MVRALPPASFMCKYGELLPPYSSNEDDYLTGPRPPHYDFVYPQLLPQRLNFQTQLQLGLQLQCWNWGKEHKLSSAYSFLKDAHLCRIVLDSSSCPVSFVLWFLTPHKRSSPKEQGRSHRVLYDPVLEVKHHHFWRMKYCWLKRSVFLSGGSIYRRSWMPGSQHRGQLPHHCERPGLDFKTSRPGNRTRFLFCRF